MKFRSRNSRPQKSPSSPSKSSPSSSPKFLQGQVKRHPDGFGFFIPDTKDHPDVYIPRHSMARVMSNDKVLVEVSPEPGGQRFRGEVIRIVSRATTKVVGNFNGSKAGGYLRDDSKSWGQDIKIPMEDVGAARDGDLVEVEIVRFPESEGDPLVGRVRQVIGSTSDPLTDIKRVLVSQQIPHEFSRATVAEAEKIPHEVTPDQWKGRKDLRPLHFITIDGATAKDFDDAILVQSEGSGFRLWVAIADVSHYVKEGNAIDRDAYERGTSVYFPNFVVPMLPEVLSNGLCSLNPHVPRLSLVCEMQMDAAGVVQKSEFFEAVIESHARVTYGEAQDVIEGHGAAKLEKVAEDIRNAAALARILMAKRFREGSLDLEIPEVQIVLDSTGQVVDMIKSERLFAHRLIEELMLAANIEAAKLFESRQAPGLYRVHEPPKAEMIDLLKNYLEQFGARSNFDSGMLQKRLTQSLQEFTGRPEAQVLNILALRSMNQAKYSNNNQGHFGLGFEFYTHFTSPIRRYPDLIVHRIIKQLIRAPGYNRVHAEEELATAGTILSASEQRAVKAERMFVSIKKARFMMNHIGEEFDGVISSVARFGVFVLLRNFEVDGLIRMENLAKEKLEFDEEHLWLVGTRSGMKYAIGDSVRIRVANADPIAGQIDFELASQPAAQVREEARGASSQERTSHRNENRQSPKSRREEELQSRSQNSRGGRRRRAHEKRRERESEQPAPARAAGGRPAQRSSGPPQKKRFGQKSSNGAYETRGGEEAHSSSRQKSKKNRGGGSASSSNKKRFSEKSQGESRREDRGPRGTKSQDSRQNTKFTTKKGAARTPDSLRSEVARPAKSRPESAPPAEAQVARPQRFDARSLFQAPKRSLRERLLGRNKKK